MTSLISIIIPVYNVANYLPRCLDSVCNQTYPNLEIILVDDGSTDNGLEICQAYAQKDKRITVIHQKNSGLSAARNTGLDHMHGEFFTFIDSDDWITADYCQTLLEISQQTQADFAWGGFTLVTMKNSFSRSQEAFLQISPKKQILSLDETIRLSLLAVDHAAWGKLFRTKKLGHLRFNGFYAQSEDLDFFIQLLTLRASASYTPKPIYFYNKQNPNAITVGFNFTHQRKILDQYAQWREFCRSNHLHAALEELNDYANSFYYVFLTLAILTASSKDIKQSFADIITPLITHRHQIWRNRRMQIPGKLFITGVSLLPKTSCFLCRLPLVKPLLQFLFNKRIYREIPLPN